MVEEDAGKGERDLKDLSDFGDELVECAGTLKLGGETKEQISRFVNEVQSALSKPMKIDAKHLAQWFPSADNAVLVDGEKLVVRQGKKESAVSLLELEPNSKAVRVLRLAPADVVPR